LFCCSGSDENEGEDQLRRVRESPPRRAAPRYARLGKRLASTDDDEDPDQDDRLTLSHRAVPTNFRFAGLGKRRVSLAYKAAGLGK